MIDNLLTAAVAAVGVSALSSGRALYQLHRHCLCLERDRGVSRGLLRWYTEGFERPLQLTHWLVRVSLGLVVLAVVTHAPPALIAAAAAALAFSYAELHLGERRHRDHRRAALSAAVRRR